MSSTPIVKSNYTIIIGSLHTSELSWKRIGILQFFKMLARGKPVISPPVVLAETAWERRHMRLLICHYRMTLRLPLCPSMYGLCVGPGQTRVRRCHSLPFTLAGKQRWAHGSKVKQMQTLGLLNCTIFYFLYFFPQRRQGRDTGVKQNLSQTQGKLLEVSSISLPRSYLLVHSLLSREPWALRLQGSSIGFLGHPSNKRQKTFCKDLGRSDMYNCVTANFVEEDFRIFFC